jgi:hypothetical protein
MNSALDRLTIQAELESVLLSIDVFPRAALLLSVFEGVPIEDLTVLLDADRDLVKKARGIGLEELNGGLSRSRVRPPAATALSVVHDGTQQCLKR